jgi:N-acetylglucosaminyl-diphospho-decaprenol L-rhamnosyltransferase
VKLSVIIVSWNVREDLTRCLRSISKNSPACEFEVIVVDNASSDGTAECVRRDFPAITLIANEQNRGFAAANNQAIRIARGEYLFLLNPDTVVHCRSLDNLIKILDENSRAGICAPRILNADGTIYHSVKRIVTFRGVLYAKTFFRYLGIFKTHYNNLRPANFDYDKQAEVEQISGAAILVKRSVIMEIGPMDEDLFLYYEDVDLCLRTREAGWEIIYVPDAVITHTGGMSSEQISADRRIIEHKSLLIYLRKHRGKLATVFFIPLFKTGVIIKELLDIATGAFTYLFSVVSGNSRGRHKSAVKIKESAAFLATHSLEFLLKS